MPYLICGLFKCLQYVPNGWPLGMPVVRKMESGLWGIRCRLDKCIARILFTVKGTQMVPLHGFIKKSRKTPQADLQLAKECKANLEK
ncbi:MAG TPA: type II toxin-antitoxin system RelE/ParE family toxin [Gammaproteobacteria bacterium]|nr:type II toxin-antitoxin system RelE/ParE family toxin [Gammaproteobacteria bacterium]